MKQIGASIYKYFPSPCLLDRYWNTVNQKEGWGSLLWTTVSYLHFPRVNTWKERMRHALVLFLCELLCVSNVNKADGRQEARVEQFKSLAEQRALPQHRRSVLIVVAFSGCCMCFVLFFVSDYPVKFMTNFLRYTKRAFSQNAAVPGFILREHSFAK